MRYDVLRQCDRMNLLRPWRVSVVAAFAACSRGGDSGAVDASLDVTTNDADASGAMGVSAEAGDAASSVLERNNGPSRDGMFVQPTLTHAAASHMARDTHFDGTISGAVLASPLYFQPRPGEHGLVIVATETNDVYALDEFSGSVVWKRHLGPPASSTGVGCGNVLPLGVTGTPYIDPLGRTLYVDAAIGDGTAANAILTHEIHALSLVDGSERPGWPADTRGLVASGITFVPQAQNQRGSLTGMGGVLFVPYGGHAGDCGNYHGWVVAVPFADPKHPTGFVTSASGAGIWGPGGLANDGTAVFAATGNALGAATWSGGEAVLRLQPNGHWSGSSADYFTPSNWKYLDAQDLDLGASGPVLLDVPGASPSALVVAVAKAGVMYLLDRSNLGGVGHGDGGSGEGVTSSPVDSFVISVSAAYHAPSGTYIVTHGRGDLGGSTGGACAGDTFGDFFAVRVGATNPPTLTPAWCVPAGGYSSAIVTTLDGTAGPIVWRAGAASTSLLKAWDGETGAVLFDGGGTGDQLTYIRPYTSPIAVHGRIIAAGDNRVYAFSSQ